MNPSISTLAEIDILVTQTKLLSENSASYHEMECHSAIRVSLRTKRSGVRVPSGAPRQAVHHQMCCLFFYVIEGLEGRAVQSNSPVDCCDRERPSRRSGGANRVPSGAPIKIVEIPRVSAIFVFVANNNTNRCNGD